MDSMIGEQVSDRSGKYIVRIGPLSGEQFQMLLNNKKHVAFISDLLPTSYLYMLYFMFLSTNNDV